MIYDNYGSHHLFIDYYFHINVLFIISLNTVSILCFLLQNYSFLQRTDFIFHPEMGKFELYC